LPVATSSATAPAIKQVDPVGAQPSQRGVRHPTDLLGAAVQADGFAVLDVPAEFGGEDHLVAQRFERFADEFLVDVRAIDLGGVKERDAALDGAAQDTDHLVAVARVRAVALAHPHAAETESGHLQALAERSGLHDVLPLGSSPAVFPAPNYLHTATEPRPTPASCRRTGGP
jgi:hypothetical protein